MGKAVFKKFGSSRQLAKVTGADWMCQVSFLSLLFPCPGQEGGREKQNHCAVTGTVPASENSAFKTGSGEQTSRNGQIKAFTDHSSYLKYLLWCRYFTKLCLYRVKFCPSAARNPDFSNHHDTVHIALVGYYKDHDYNKKTIWSTTTP